MLIKKGGITRNIDETRLHEYTAKGYAPLAAREDTPRTPSAAPAGGEKQPRKPDAKE